MQSSKRTMGPAVHSNRSAQGFRSSSALRLQLQSLAHGEMDFRSLDARLCGGGPGGDRLSGTRSSDSPRLPSSKFRAEIRNPKYRHHLQSSKFRLHQNPNYGSVRLKRDAKVWCGDVSDSASWSDVCATALREMRKEQEYPLTTEEVGRLENWSSTQMRARPARTTRDEKREGILEHTTDAYRRDTLESLETSLDVVVTSSPSPPHRWWRSANPTPAQRG
ncbi:hypothetical protein BZA05DRAFT_188292 [Tricharina praecox]|uniref:uncharacterized protein n=1 Tax=Tricharina praecox TaxID=43433 RepID=UPI00221F4E02|nr:uncharacterized protein BZA05DRAFT_188292 [Tricharina praecox]KAI5842811.1 hypothetical protein BZA05DRAFT_188292 [Tricharina praecox]